MSLDATLYISVTLIGNPNEYTTVPVFIPHLKKSVDVKVPNFIEENATLRLAGLGYVGSNGEKGNLFLKFSNIIRNNEAKKHCARCGNELNSGAKFCSGCGSSVFTNGNRGSSQRETVYEGNIHKCPVCGERLASFVSFCPSCGHEIRGASNSYAVQDFANRLLNAKNNQEKISIIRNFPIPNTKEDIIEFMILASTNVGENLEAAISVAWQSKIEQAYQKAQIVFQNKDELSRIENIYLQVCDKLSKYKKNKTAKKIKSGFSEIVSVFPNFIITFGWLASVFLLLPLCGVGLDNVGANGYQLLLIGDLIVGAVFIPLATKCTSQLPKMITTLGLILSVVILISLCGRNLDNVGANAYQIILIANIVCGIVIVSRMFGQKHKKDPLNSSSFAVALICVALLFAIYIIGTFNNG